MTNLVFLLIPILVLWTWLLPIGFAAREVEGTVLRTMPISLLARMKRHALPNIVTMSVACILVLFGFVSPWWLALAGASALAILAVPQSYVVTTRGIRTGRGNFRRWTEFAGVHRSAAGATLKTIRRGPGMPIWLSGSRDDDEFVHLLRTMIRDSYKGKLAVAPMTMDRTSTESPDLTGVAAYTQDI
jgi:hypothetical protein